MSDDAFMRVAALEETKSLLDGQNHNRLSQLAPKVSSVYLLWAGIGATLMGIASTLRGIESGTPLPAKFSLSLSYLVLSLLTLIVYRCRMGSKFRAPW